jgi:hypothetical protein
MQYDFEKYNCDIIQATDDYLIIVPHDWDCAGFLYSPQCGGGEIRWWSQEKASWDHYSAKGDVFFVVFFSEKDMLFGKKILIHYDFKNNEYEVCPVDYLRLNGHDLPELLSSIVRGNYMKIFPRTLWLHCLQYEKEKNRQLFFKFDIFRSLKISDEVMHCISVLTPIIHKIDETIHSANFKEILSKIKYDPDELSENQPQYTVSRDYIEELYGHLEEYRIKIHEYHSLIVNNYHKLLEIAVEIYEKGNEADKEKIRNTIELMDKEWHQ